MTQPIDWEAIAPPLALAIAALGALLVEAFAPRIRSAAGIVSLVGIGVALVSTVSMRGEPQSAFCFAGGLEQPTSCSWIVDDVTLAWWLIMLVATALVVLLCWPAAALGRALARRAALPAALVGHGRPRRSPRQAT